MLRFAFFSLAAVLGFAQGGWIQPQTPGNSVAHGICGSAGCYVDIDQETRLLHLDERTSPNNDPCITYICTTDGVIEQRVTCPAVTTCHDGSPSVGFPNTCCPACLGTREHEVCSFTEWSGWGRCSKTCGGGKQARVRRPIRPTDAALSIYCEGGLTEIQDCSRYLCPVHCEWEYGEFGECSVSCGRGEKRRFPIITQQPQHGGAPCPPFVYENRPEVKECSLQPCPGDDGKSTVQEENSSLVNIVEELLEKYYNSK